ncbi:MAG: threonine synthase [Burkholderiales bacterium]|nr:threonine synthase [Burkholderiales bacterium]
MRYVSTRGAAAPRRFGEILLEGLAPDGGLYVPERWPAADLDALRDLPYPALAHALLAPFMDDVPQLAAIVARTYTKEAFGSAAIVPLRTLESGLHLLALSNGPTLAFKDIALQLLGNLFEAALAARGETLTVLGATSGDTGSAAEYAWCGKRGIRVFMLSPHGRMSEFQRAQMYSLDAPNVHNLAVCGTFDDCQDLVKAVNADAAFKARYRIGAVNSINWARIAAQTVYYFAGWFAARRAGAEAISFAVPTGNFGNIYAGFVARAMGLPIRRLVLATNENDVLDEFFRTGRYRPRRTAQATSSPSMDITRASNFERYVYELVGRDGARLAALWRRLEAEGELDLGAYREAIAASGFASGRSTHAERLATIRAVYERYGAIIDPHTADGVGVALRLREPGETMVCLETAQAAKFAATIREAIGREPPRPRGLEDLERRPQRFAVIDPDPEALKRAIAEACGA